MIDSIADLVFIGIGALLTVAFGLIVFPERFLGKPEKIKSELEETSSSKRQATIVVDCPNCIKKYPPSIEDMLRMQDFSNPKNPLRSGKTTCPKCGKPARLYLDYLKGD